MPHKRTIANLCESVSSAGARILSRTPPSGNPFPRVLSAVILALAFVAYPGPRITSAARFNAPADSPISVAAPEPEKPTHPDPPPKDEELAKKLIHGPDADSSGVMTEIMELMDRSAEQVGREFDPGPATRLVQQSIIAKLDEAISSARHRKSKNQNSTPSTGESRETLPPTKGQKDQQNSAADSAGEVAGVKQGQAAEAQPATPVREIRRSWGHLPFRDRDEILQGIDEDSVERFRDLIEEYYRALAEDEKE